MTEPNGDSVSVEENAAWWLIVLGVLIHDGPLIEKLPQESPGISNVPQNVIDAGIAFAKTLAALPGAGTQVDVARAIRDLAEVRRQTGTGEVPETRLVLPEPNPPAGSVVCFNAGPHGPRGCFKVPSVKGPVPGPPNN